MEASFANIVATSTWYSQIPSLSWIILSSGGVALSLALLLLTLSKLGEARPIAKCVVLSIWAHMLLVGFLYTTKFIKTKPTDIVQNVSIQLMEDELGNTEEPAKKWDQVPTDTIPQLKEWDADRRSTAVNDWDRQLEPQPATEEPLVDSIITDVADFDFKFLDESETEPDLVATMEPAAIETIEPMQAQEAVEPIPDMEAPDRTSTDQIVARDLPQVTDETKDLEAEILDLLEQTAITENEQEYAVTEQIVEKHIKTLEQISPLPNTKRPQARLVKQTQSPQVPKRYQRRIQDRLSSARRQGGGTDTEAAVLAALKWLASVQATDGRWDASDYGAGVGVHRRRTSNASGAHADTAITGLALLSFLGAGHTHADGDYRKTVQHGLEFLLRSQASSSGSLAGDAAPMAAMYCHGIATLALSEAYLLSNDEKIYPFLEKAVRYTIAAQHPTTGGWRYRIGDSGDTSQFGWQLMALISAQSAGLNVPQRSIDGMHRWIDRVSSGRQGGLASYKPGERHSKVMTAEALVCRFFLGEDANSPAIQEAADLVSQCGLRGRVLNLYHCYYATLGLFRLQDQRWIAWNDEMKGRLLPIQRTNGRLAGSWDPNTVWGRNGGRVYSTALATLSLQVYYRYDPDSEKQTDRTAVHLKPLRR